jgi:transcriptional regulator with XRE-family HTH domain
VLNHSPSLSKLGIRSRRAWALRAGVSPSLISHVVRGEKALTPRVRRLLALAACCAEEDVPAILASTRTKETAS